MVKHSYVIFGLFLGILTTNKAMSSASVVLEHSPQMAGIAPEKPQPSTRSSSASSGSLPGLSDTTTSLSGSFSNTELAAEDMRRKVFDLRRSDPVRALGYAQMLANRKLGDDPSLSSQKLARDQYEYACMLEDGVGCSKNPGAAFVYHLQAAERGDAFAQNAIAIYYERGIPGKLEVDKEEALGWYHEAGKQGIEAALDNMARLLDELDKEKGH